MAENMGLTGIISPYLYELYYMAFGPLYTSYK